MADDDPKITQTGMPSAKSRVVDTGPMEPEDPAPDSPLPPAPGEGGDDDAPIEDNPPPPTEGGVGGTTPTTPDAPPPIRLPPGPWLPPVIPPLRVPPALPNPPLAPSQPVPAPPLEEPPELKPIEDWLRFYVIPVLIPLQPKDCKSARQRFDKIDQEIFHLEIIADAISDDSQYGAKELEEYLHAISERKKYLTQLKILIIKLCSRLQV